MQDSHLTFPVENKYPLCTYLSNVMLVPYHPTYAECD